MEKRRKEEWGVETWKPQKIKKPGIDALEWATGGQARGGLSAPKPEAGESFLPPKTSQPPALQSKEPEYGAEERRIHREPTVSYAAGRENKKTAPAPSYAAGLQPSEPSWAELSGIKGPAISLPQTPAYRAPQAESDWKERAWRSGRAAPRTRERYGPKLSTGTQTPAETGQGDFRRYARQPEIWELRDPAQVQYELEEVKKQYHTLYQEALDTLDRAEWSEDRNGTMAEAARKYKDAFALSPQISALKKELEEIEEAQRRYLMEQEGYREATLWDSTVGSFKQGYNTAELGKESYKEMMGDVDSRRAEYEEKLAGEEYKFVPENWWKEAISSVSSWGGELLSKTADPLTLGLMGSYAGAAALSGNAGPQALLPEEGITVPGAMVAGFEMGTTTNDIKIQAGLAYDELRKNGVSKDTAQTIAMAVGGVNGLLGALPEELLEESFNILKNSGTSTTILQTIVNELKKRGVNILWGTAQDVVQEGVTIAGVQAGTKMDSGQWAYSAEEVGDRLKNTVVDAILTNGILEIPGAVKNIGADIDRHIQQSGWISDQVARSMLGDFDIMDFLTRRGGLSITKDMNLNQEITAIKNAVTAVLQKKGNRLQGGSG